MKTLILLLMMALISPAFCGEDYDKLRLKDIIEDRAKFYDKYNPKHEAKTFIIRVRFKDFKAAEKGSVLEDHWAYKGYKIMTVKIAGKEIDVLADANEDDNRSHYYYACFWMPEEDAKMRLVLGPKIK